MFTVQEVGQEFKVSFSLVTPEIASRWLEKNGSNRPIRKGQVRFFSTLLREGTFKTTHQGVAIGTEGQLIDGQHRLSAIVETGIPALLMISEGVDPKSFGYLDCGIKRSLSDRVVLDENDHFRNAKLTAVCRSLHTMESMQNQKSSRGATSVDVVMATYEKYGDSIRVVVDDIFFSLTKDIRQSFTCNCRILAACILLHKYSPEEGLFFAQGLLTGVAAPSGTDPVWLCRSHLTKRRLTDLEMIRRVFWAMNSSHNSKTAKHCGKAEAPWFLKNVKNEEPEAQEEKETLPSL